jgi:hypothetical protein
MNMNVGVTIVCIILTSDPGGIGMLIRARGVAVTVHAV